MISQILTRAMRKSTMLIVTVTCLCIPVFGQSIAQSKEDGAFKLALANHNGQMSWSADGFKVIQSSAKQNGNEIGFRGSDGSDHLYFLGFLFLFPEQAPMTSAKCRDSVIGPEKSSNSSFKILNMTEIARSNGLPVSLVDYSAQGSNGKTEYMVRGFIATADLCADLELYSDIPIHSADTNVRNILASFTLDPNHAPTFFDIFRYAQTLYDAQQFAAAAPIFEEVLIKVNASPDQGLDWIRMLTDQTGMSYGMSGNIPKARAIFEKAIVSDPNYPIYYYDLACADAEEHDLANARKHLQQAFDRKANVIAGEKMPDPSQDDSFIPYRNNKEFWSFIESLHTK